MKNIAELKDCYVSTISLMALKRFGPDSLDWEPEVLRDNFEQQFNIKKMPQRSFDKLNAGYAMIGTDLYTASLETFLQCTATMNNHVISDNELSFCTLPMCQWGVWEYINLTGEMKDGLPQESFHPDICQYIVQVAKLNGITELPDCLKFQQNTDSKLPDMTWDANVFEMYQKRQQQYIGNINIMLADKQARLLQQLQEQRQLGNL